MLRHLQHLDEQLNAVPFDDQHNQRADNAGRKDTIDHIRVLDEQQRAGGQAMDQESAQHHGCHTVAWDTQHQQRDHGAADGRVVRCFRRNNAFRISLAECFRMLGHVLGGHIGKHTGCGSANTGQDTDSGTDQSGAQRPGQPLHEFLHREAEALHFLNRDRFHTLADGFGRYEDIRHRENTDQGGQGVEAAHHFIAAEGEAGRSVNRGHTDHREQQTQHPGQKSLHHVARAQHGHHGQSEEADTEVFNRCKLQRHIRQHRCKE